MLIFGPLAGPTTSAVTLYAVSSAGSLMTVPSSTTSSAGNVTLDPASSSSSLSTVSTSSRATFSCLPPQRTIAYTRELPLPCACPASLDALWPREPSDPRRARHEPDMPSYVHETTAGGLLPGLGQASPGRCGSMVPVPADPADRRGGAGTRVRMSVGREPRCCERPGGAISKHMGPWPT